ncbi:HmuY family protein [Dyadobacter tibetensis]|uniref:HmuY family protein n=1 Tax=Dyadobacter tibetensis TaxID=1211851 RepID=UPI00046F73AC|nr:HmuY family protein [Dyadobacter tibetensis]
MNTLLINGLIVFLFSNLQLRELLIQKNLPSSPIIKIAKDIDARSSSFRYYDLDLGVLVEENQDWDIAFSKTTVKVNSLRTKPRQVMVQVVNQWFDSISVAPTDGYLLDTRAKTVIAPGSGNGWYLYDMGKHAILPIPERSILLKTTDGNYVKLQILSYYRGMPELVPTEDAGFYTFRYSLANRQGHF